MLLKGQLIGLTHILAGVLLTGTFAFADSIEIYNTGVNADYSLAAAGAIDPNYTSVSGTVYVEASPYPTWEGADGLSQWIGPDAVNGSSVIGPPPLDYQVSFDLTGFNLSTTTIQGQYAVDDELDGLLINGAPVGGSFCSISCWNQWSPFTVSSGFVAGINTIDFEWLNTNGAGGLRVEFISATDGMPTTPEPGSMGLVIIGLVGFAATALRRRAKA